MTLAPASFRRLRWGGVVYAALTAPADRTTTIALRHRADGLPPAAERFAAILRNPS